MRTKVRTGRNQSLLVENGASTNLSEWTPRLLSSPARLVWVLAFLFTTHVLIRTASSSVADLDEAGQLIFTQNLQWGYGPQPPLYTWLQLGFFKVFGPGIVGLSLLKNTLLFLIYVFVYGTARLISRSHVTGLVAAMGLMFIPQLAWESQRDLTHSVLATTMAAATLLVFVRLTQTNARWLYLTLGACIGLGLLSNYSYALLAVGLILAALTVPEYRRRILLPWLLLSLAVATALVLPHALWALDHPNTVLATSHKLKIQPSVSWLNTALAPFLSLAAAWFSHVISIAAVYLVLCWKQVVPFSWEAARHPPAVLLLRTVVIPLSLVIIAMLATQATAFKGRWLQPIYICIPILMALWTQPRWNRSATRRFLFLSVGVILLVSITLAARFGVDPDRADGLNRTFTQLLPPLRADAEKVDFIIAEDAPIGGNLRLAFPHKMVITPQFTPERWTRSGKTCLIVFNATRKAHPPAALARLISLETGLDPTGIRWSYADAQPSPAGKPLRFGYASVTLQR